MKEISEMRLGVLRELKKIKFFFQDMENGVKSRRPDMIYPAYVFIKTLAYHMNEGDLSETSIELHHALLNAELRLNNKNKDAQNEVPTNIQENSS